MTSVVRQPFAPIDGARLQSLTSTKNRQNSTFLPSSKRKASEAIEIDDTENIDPVLFLKRSKGNNGTSAGCKKPTGPTVSATRLTKDVAPDTRPRTILKPRAPSAKSRSSIASPAGPAPSRRSVNKRGGILSNRRRSSYGLTRIDPVGSNLAPAAPFSLDAALKGTLSAFSSPFPSASTTLGDNEIDSSWVFDIHEDSPEQEMTNLLQHSTCVLDISSDEESEQKARRDEDEGRDKENIPPANDISQTNHSRSEPIDDMLVEKSRNPLSQLDASDFYAAGCDEATVVFVPCDDAEEDEAKKQELIVPLTSPESDKKEGSAAQDFGEETRLVNDKHDGKATAEELMSNRNEPGSIAAVLEPLDGTGESFELWESGSSKDTCSPPSAACGDASEEGACGQSLIPL